MVGVLFDGFYVLSMIFVFGFLIIGYYLIVIMVFMWLVFEYILVGWYFYVIGVN